MNYLNRRLTSCRRTIQLFVASERHSPILHRCPWVSFRCTCSIALSRHTSYTTVKFLLRPLPRHHRQIRTSDRRHERSKNIFCRFLPSIRTGPLLRLPRYNRFHWRILEFAIVNSTKFFTPEEKSNHSLLYTGEGGGAVSSHLQGPTTHRRECFVTLAYYSLATIIHAQNNVTALSLELDVTRNEKHVAKERFTMKSRLGVLSR